MRETINVTLPLSDGGGDIYFFALLTINDKGKYGFWG